MDCQLLKMRCSVRRKSAQEVSMYHCTDCGKESCASGLLTFGRRAAKYFEFGVHGSLNAWKENKQRPSEVP